jgi:rhodanese-related sulfurtransferase
MGVGYAGDIDPLAAWQLLRDHPDAELIDVRTAAEWAYVGVPDLSSLGKRPIFVSWLFFPTMSLNEQFVEQVMSAGVRSDAPLIFICRSGVRSRAAAIRMTEAGFPSCYNIGSGFEGDPDPDRHRGRLNGWKVEGLPWVQT